MPAAASFSAAHKGRIQNIRAATLRETKEERKPGVVILNFEDESVCYDKSQKEHLGYSGMKHVVLDITMHLASIEALTHVIYLSEHMEEYFELGHEYICDYSLNPSYTWVLAMSPIMAGILSKAECVEVDTTFRASIELEYLLNVVCFDYDSLLCKFFNTQQEFIQDFGIGGGRHAGLNKCIPITIIIIIIIGGALLHKCENLPLQGLWSLELG